MDSFRVRGFTLLELAIALAILLILAAIGIGAFANFRDTRELDRAADDVMNLAREARARTLASEEDSQFGVYFESGRAVLFRGASYSEGAPGNEEHVFPARVEAHSITVPSSVVIFDRLTGATSNAGVVSFRLKSDSSQTRTITITAPGLMYVE